MYVFLVVINHCQPDPCENGGICINGIDDFTCDCQEVNDVAYDGRTCDTGMCLCLYDTIKINIKFPDIHLLINVLSMICN